MKLAGGKLFFYCASQKLSSENQCMADRISNEALEKIVLEQIKKQVKELADLDFVRKTALRAVKEKQAGIVRNMEIVDQEILLKYAGFAELTTEMADAFADRIEIGQDKEVHIFWRFHGRKAAGQRRCLSEV